MTSFKLIIRSLFFYRRTHLGIFLGVVVSTAILVGALVVGDSVRYSLKQIVVSRLGQTEFAISSGDRFFRPQLADKIAAALDTRTAPLMQMSGVAIGGGGSARANRIQVIGVDERFWAMGPGAGPFFKIAPDEAVVNRALASRLGLKEGDEFLLRVGKVNLLPRDAPLSLDSDTSVALRLKVKAIALDEQFGRFSLRANQVAPLSVFLSLPWLAQQLDLAGQANVMLLAGKPGAGLTAEKVNGVLRKEWDMADSGLELRALPGPDALELRSSRIFLDPVVADAALKAGYGAKGILTYFINQITAGEKSTPYSFVSSPGAPLVPADMASDEIIINDWLAADLGVGKGDSIGLKYYVLGPMRKMEEKTSNFRVRSVTPLAGPAADRDLMPAFPGLANINNCRDWNPGIPMDVNKIRKNDEDYWKEYRGTPKAFIGLDTARLMWQNRFGSLTAVRFTGGAREREIISSKITSMLDPAALGLAFNPVRQEGDQAGAGTVDFGQLFIGLSFFIVVAALLLTNLLFVFGVEHRAGETGILLALGFTPARIVRLFLAEGAVLAITGGVIGSICGIFYNQVVIHALGSLWRGAVGTSELRFHLEPLTLLMGALAGMAVAFVAIWLAARKQTGKTVSELRGLGSEDSGHLRKGKFWLSLLVAVACGAAVLVIFSFVSPGRGKDAAGAFFAAGGLMLVGGLALCNVILLKLARGRGAEKISTTAIGLRNCARRRGRSLATIGMLSCGIFLVVAVAANRHDPLKDIDSRKSGTGGFALFGETAIPVLYDLNTEKGRRVFGLDNAEFAGLKFVHLRVREGDDASCLNLNRVRQPRIISVRPGEFAGRFAFVKTADGVDREKPWPALNGKAGDDAIPGVADQDVIAWNLGKSVGDTIAYVDESGKNFKVKLVGGLAGSIFQGNIIISEAAFTEKFPSISGATILLVDAPADKVFHVMKTLSIAMQDVGLDLVRAAQRLAEFNAVENTYLSIFLVLGGLGLILGSVGMGIVVMRNILERRGELALLRAVGFSRWMLRWSLLSEHWLLLAAGLACGMVAALVAVLPALAGPGADVPFASLAVVLAGLVASGTAWTLLATVLATRGDLLAALRNE